MKKKIIAIAGLLLAVATGVTAKKIINHRYAAKA